MALCHMTELTNRNLYQTMVVTNDVQLSNDFDGFYLVKEVHVLIYALSPRVIHNIAFSESPLFCQLILHRKPMKCKISELFC